MSYQVEVNHKLIPNPNFKELTLQDITKLYTEDVAPLEIDFTTGEIKLNGEPVRRLYEYFKAYAKPIQYRKVINVIGVYDFKSIREVVEDENHKALLSRAEAFEALNEEETALLLKICQEVAGELPQASYEEQIIGYEYTENDEKVKIELISNKEQDVFSIVAKITITDLVNRIQHEPSFKRLY